MIFQAFLLPGLTALLTVQPSPWTMARLPGTGQTFTSTRPLLSRNQPVASENGAERWAGSCHREILDHVIALSYYDQGRIHHFLDTPNRRPIEQKAKPHATLISNPRLGGLHHRYSWREAA